MLTPQYIFAIYLIYTKRKRRKDGHKKREIQLPIENAEEDCEASQRSCKYPEAINGNVHSDSDSRKVRQGFKELIEAANTKNNKGDLYEHQGIERSS